MDLLNTLNPPQQQAVCHKEGPLLVLAGPGSGKTKVITHRIAYLIQQGIPSYQILAVTFTNKAAEEMAERVKKLVPVCHAWISTFHSFCTRMLYQHAYHLGYGPNFSIYDSDDQRNALKQVVNNYEVANNCAIDLKETWGKISYYKNQAMSPEDIEKNDDPKGRRVAALYRNYQQLLTNNNAMDFDDLLLRALELLSNYNEILQHYQTKFRYILIDEFQDTNSPQYQIAKLLAQAHSNICATGDPDQSIYSWRGANIGNILKFEQDFPGTVVVKLEQNYRSTKYILEAASHVIMHNILRKEKALWTQNGVGNKLRLVQNTDAEEEARMLVRDIRRWQSQGYSLNDMVIFYRTNAQSRVIEMMLRNEQIAYILVGGYEFFDRAEIKDLMAYLRIVANPNDEISLLRILNVPPRGIGAKTLDKVMTAANIAHCSLLQTLSDPLFQRALSARARHHIGQFVEMLDNVKKYDQHDLVKLVQELLRQSGYLEHIKDQDYRKDQTKESNLNEFISMVAQYEKSNPNHSLTEFLQHISLYTNPDRREGDEQEPAIQLMTLHAAKGLEFPVVYIVGVNQGLLPHFMSQGDAELEEERRLFFVGITRARQILTISFNRFVQVPYSGLIDIAEPSPFLAEIPPSAYEWLNFCGRFPPNLQQETPRKR